MYVYSLISSKCLAAFISFRNFSAPQSLLHPHLLICGTRALQGAKDYKDDVDRKLLTGLFDEDF